MYITDIGKLCMEGTDILMDIMKTDKCNIYILNNRGTIERFDKTEGR